MTAQTPDLPAIPDFEGLRLAKRTVEALDGMAWLGLTLKDAAEAFGIRRDNLTRAFGLPAVQQRWRLLQRHIRQGEGQAAIARIAVLARTAKSEHVRLAANQWLAGIEGTAPVSKVQGSITHRHEFRGFDYPQLIEGEAQELIPSDPAALIEG